MSRPPARPAPPHPAIDAALSARALADEAAIGDEARRDAFAALLYGFATAFETHAEPGEHETEPLAERVGTLATTLAREALGMGFRDACRCIEAIEDALVAARPRAEVAGLVNAGAAAATEWLAGRRDAFAARVLQATCDDAFASQSALRPRR